MPQPFDFAKGYVLTDEDVKVLRPLIEKHQRDRGNELLFRYGYEEPYWLDEGPPSQRSGTHIALVPVGGIAALTNPAGTGDDNIAGMAVCSIYQIAIDVTGTIATVVDTGLMERVYNLSLTPITSRYVIVHLDRYGRWVAGTTDDTIPASGTTEITNIINNYSTLEDWKQINIDNTLADDYGLTVCYGPFDLTTFSDDNAVGSETWNNPTNALTSNNTRADAGTIQLNGAITHYLKGLQMAGGYAPAVGFVPKTVHVMVERRDGVNGGAIVDSSVKLVVGGVVQATNKASAVVWPASDTVMTYRFPTTATRAQTLAADFGVVISTIYNGTTGGAVLLFNDTAPVIANYTEGIGLCQLLSTGSVCSVVSSNSGGGVKLAYDITRSSWTEFRTVAAGAFKNAETFDPSVSGALVTVDFETTSRLDTASAGVGAQVVYAMIYQGGLTYFAVLGTITLGAGDTVNNLAGLTAASFVRWNGSDIVAGTPDFTNGVMQFGIGFSMGVTADSSAEPIFKVLKVTTHTAAVVGGKPEVDHVQIRICGTT